MSAQSTEQSQDVEQQGTQHWAVWSVYARDNDRTVPTHEQETAAVQEFDALVEQLAAEGVVQILKNEARGDASPVMAAVGPMQFEVVAARMKAEFNVEARMEPLGYGLARRTDAESAVELGRQRGVEVFTRSDGAILALVSDKWRLQYLQKEMPELTLEPLVAAAD